MGAYNIDRLLDEILQEKGPPPNCKPTEKSHFRQAWEAFNRYVTATIEKKQTLEVPNFCKIGWRILDHHQGVTKWRPHFQLAESFIRVHQLDAKLHVLVPDGQLAPIKEFNYSEAAIKYSQGLTKGNMFTGLRAIVQKIGDASLSHQLSLDFEIGQFLCKDHVAHFAFAGELYLQEGLEIPKSCFWDDDSEQKQPSVTFGPVTTEGLALSIRGRSSCGEAASRCLDDVDDGAASATSAGVSLSGVSAKERVRMDMLERHLEDVQAEADEVVTEKSRVMAFEDKIVQKEEAVANIKREFYLDHKEQLKRQIRELEEKRQRGRENAVVGSSQHDFPSFREDPPSSDVHEYMGDLKKYLKDDLDQQVRQKHALKDIIKRQEAEHMAKDVAQNKADIQIQVVAEKTKKAVERSLLAESWERSIRLKQAQKVIDRHHMSAAKDEAFSDRSSFAALRKDVPGLVLPGQRPETGSNMSSRPPTGSARKVPTLGAAGSLALRRKQLQGQGSARKQPASART